MGYPGNVAPSTTPMLHLLNTSACLTEPAMVSSVEPCWHNFNMKRQPGYSIALAARCVR